MIFLSIILLLFFIVFVLSFAKMPNLPARLLAGYLIGFSELVLINLIASLFGKMSEKGFILELQAILVAVTGLIWFLIGRPDLFGGIKSAAGELKGMQPKVVLKRHPVVSLLGLAALCFYLFNLVLIWIVPPNSSDSLHTHLSRVGYWLQNGSMLPWATTNAKQLFYPVNVSLQVFWTILFWGTDRLAGYVQWGGAVATILVVFGFARLLSAGRAQAVFAAVVWSSFTVVLMQSTSVQVDLVTAALFMSSMYFLLLGMKKENKTAFVFSGLGIALALGAKQIMLFYLPSVILFCLVNLKFWKKHLSSLLAWGVSSILFFILLSSYIYISNYITFGNFAGPGEVVASSIGSNPGTLKYNIPRLVYQSVDFSGLPDPLAALGYRAKAKLMEGVAQLTGYTMEVPNGNAQDQVFRYRDSIQTTEDTAWFGFGSLVILLPAVLIAFVQSIKKKDMIVLGLILFSLSFLPVEAYFRWGWDPYQGRYFIAAVGLLAPLMYLLVNEDILSRVYRVFAAVVVVVSFAMITIYNPSKPLKSNDVEIFQASRMKLQSLAGGNALWRFSYMLNRSLPEDAVIAYYAPNLIYDYVLFGEHFTRQVIPLNDPQLLTDEDWLKAHSVQYVLVELSPDETYPVDEKLVPYDEVKEKWMMYTWSKVK